MYINLFKNGMVHVRLGKVVWRRKLFKEDRFGHLQRGISVLYYTKTHAVYNINWCWFIAS